MGFLAVGSIQRGGFGRGTQQALPGFKKRWGRAIWPSRQLRLHLEYFVLYNTYKSLSDPHAEANHYHHHHKDQQRTQYSPFPSMNMHSSWTLVEAISRSTNCLNRS